MAQRYRAVIYSNGDDDDDEDDSNDDNNESDEDGSDLNVYYGVYDTKSRTDNTEE